MRYELSDEEWTAIKPMLPNKPRGVPRVNDRRVLNGIFWVLRSGAPWRDLPNNFGPYRLGQDHERTRRGSERCGADDRRVSAPAFRSFAISRYWADSKNPRKAVAFEICLYPNAPRWFRAAHRLPTAFLRIA